MPQPSMYQKALAEIYRLYSQDAGKALVHLGTVGTVFSAAAQTSMIAKNKELDKKEKDFLMTQELADGAINVGLFYTISKAIKDYSDKLVETGMISLDSTEKILAKFRKDHHSNPVWLEQATKDYVESVKNSPFIDTFEKQNVIGKQNQYRTLFYERTIADLEKAIKADAKPSLTRKAINPSTNKELLAALKKGQKEFLGVKNGVGVIAAIAASVLASNIITPVCRNAVANTIQAKKEKTEATKKINPVYPTRAFNPICTLRV